MIYFKTKGIILYKKIRSEIDEIISFYTVDTGQILCFTRGSKKSRKRFFNALEVGNLCEIVYSFRSSRFYYYLDEVKVIDRFIHPLRELEKIQLAYFTLEVFYKLTKPEAGSAKELFKFLLFSLKKLKTIKRENYRGFLLWFAYNFLKLEGLASFLERCGTCGKHFNSKDKYYIHTPFVALCPQCSRKNQDKRIEISGKNLQRINQFLSPVYSTYYDKPLNDDVVNQILEFLFREGDFNVLKTKEFLYL